MFIGFYLNTRFGEEDIVILPLGTKKHAPLTYATRTKHSTKGRASLAMLIAVETFSKNTSASLEKETNSSDLRS